MTTSTTCRAWSCRSPRRTIERQRAEQRDARPNGKLRGIGVACYAELTGLGTSTAVGPGTLLQPGRDAVTLRLETTGVLPSPRRCRRKASAS